MSDVMRLVDTVFSGLSVLPIEDVEDDGGAIYVRARTRDGRSLFTFYVIAHAIDLRVAALPEYLENLEAALEDVADRVASSPGPDRGSHLCRVRFGERLAAA
jgi:hypothetical protein